MDKKQNATNNIKLINKNLEVLKKNFPQCFDKNGDFLIEKFQKELKSNEINFSKESYSIDWLGKSYARLLASDEATTLLKEDKAFNQKPENINSENLLIKGDNLEVLKHLAGAYYEKIKMIYIDPPYNTGKDDFVYSDERKFSVNQLRELAGIDEDKAKRILEFTQSNSNSHSAWLTFMYPRLYIAKRLLKDDGVIFISIDDNEVAQLKLIMDEIFEESNNIGNLSIINNLKGRSDDDFFATCHEYCLVYAKNADKLKISGFEITEEEIENDYKFIDDLGNYKPIGLRKTGKGWKREDRPNMFYPILFKDNFSTINDDELDKLYNTETKRFDDIILRKIIDKYENLGYEVYLPMNEKGEFGRWRWGIETFEKEKNRNLTFNSSNVINSKMRATLEDGSIRLKSAKTLWYKPQYDTGSSGSFLKNLFNSTSDLFENPKSVFLLKDILITSTQNEDIILDFFAGSGTTGDAVMQLNKEDGGNRKFILVQLPEEIDEKKNKVAYDFVKNELGVEKPTIFEITKERLIRAANRLKKDEQDVGLGFKIFETMPIWEDYNFEANKFSNELVLFDDTKLSDNDIEALLTTWKTYDGMSLTDNLKEIDLGGYVSYYGNGKLYLMNKGFSTDNLKCMLEKIDSDKSFNPTSIIVFGYKFESKNLREIAENIKAYSNKKNIDIDFITRY